MALGLPPLLVALTAMAFTPSTAASQAAAGAFMSVPMCDEAGLSDDEMEAEEQGAVEEAKADARVEAAPLPLPLTPASFARTCSAPHTPEAAAVCVDARANIWINQMSSGCSTAARPLPSHAAVRAARSNTPGGLACFGPDCVRDRIPQSAGSPSHEGRSPFVGSAPAFRHFLDAEPLFDEPRVKPSSVPPRRLLRPPIAAPIV